MADLFYEQLIIFPYALGQNTVPNDVGHNDDEGDGDDSDDDNVIDDDARLIPNPTPADHTKFRCVPRFLTGNPIRPYSGPRCASPAGVQGLLWNDDEMEKF
ncbi:hypothetical protein ANN_10727 [Periplaneta americana]|uniref:Uncharacterized protein n=1 Tax=Periplaneta americana TaxID=6978 RepID=A0ABQ8T5C8_PERAM|nr:hypothetical protein ANN_10727 [Periplaneta americana]